jgi:hypothetical protein
MLLLHVKEKETEGEGERNREVHTVTNQIFAKDRVRRVLVRSLTAGGSGLRSKA